MGKRAKAQVSAQKVPSVNGLPIIAFVGTLNTRILTAGEVPRFQVDLLQEEKS